ncbi:hypothetical protein [Salininema proteolyticum]
MKSNLTNLRETARLARLDATHLEKGLKNMSECGDRRRLLSPWAYTSEKALADIESAIDHLTEVRETVAAMREAEFEAAFRIGGGRGE